MKLKNKIKKTIEYHKKKNGINRIILSSTDKREIIHGNYAVNKQVPKFLRVKTNDIDFYSSKYKKDAKQTEKALDKFMGFNAFRTEKARHEGTMKVVSRLTGKTIADYTKSDNKIPSTKIQNLNYATLDFLKKRALQSIKDPQYKFRHDKDRDTYYRILAAQQLKKLKQQPIKNFKSN